MRNVLDDGEVVAYDAVVLATGAGLLLASFRKVLSADGDVAALARGIAEAVELQRRR